MKAKRTITIFICIFVLSCGLFLVWTHVLKPLRKFAGKVNCDGQLMHLCECCELYRNEFESYPPRIQTLADHFLNDKFTDHTSLKSFICPLSDSETGDPNDVESWSDYALLAIESTIDPNTTNEQILYCKHHVSLGVFNIRYLNGSHGRRSTFSKDDASADERMLIDILINKDSNKSLLRDRLTPAP